MLTERPLFVVGMPKSGTSMAVQVLNNHQDFSLDFEVPVVLSVLRSYKQTYDPNSNLRHYIDNMAIDPLCKKRNDDLIVSGSFRGMIRNLFGQIHSGWNLGKRWGSTTKPILNYHGVITRLFPNTEFLFVLRDPRDIWASLRSWKPGPQWHDAIKGLSMSETPKPLITRYNKFLDLFAEIDPRLQYFIKYEDIVRDPAVIYHTLKLRPNNGYPYTGLGNIYKTRHLPAPPDNRFFPDKTTTNSIGRWKEELDSKEAEQLVEGCKRLFDMGYYKI